MYLRLSTNGSIKMPPLARNLVDSNAVSVLEDWIDPVRPRRAFGRIKLFWGKTLQREWPRTLKIIRPDPHFKLPVVLSAQEVRRLLDGIKLHQFVRI